MQQLMVGVDVDDRLLIRGQSEISQLKEYLNEHMKAKDLGPASNIISIRIQRPERDIVFIDQESYIKSVHEEFEMSNCHGVSSPLAVEFQERDIDEEFNQ